MEELPLDLSVKVIVSEMVPEPVPLFTLAKNEASVPLMQNSVPTEPPEWSSFLAPLRTARLVHEV